MRLPLLMGCLCTISSLVFAQTPLPPTGAYPGGPPPGDDGGPRPLPPGGFDGPPSPPPTHEEMPPPLTGDIPHMPAEKEYDKEKE